MKKLPYIAARIGLGTFRGDEILSTVDELLEKGIYSDYFIDVLDSKPPIFEVQVIPFSKYLASVGIEIPDREQAVWNLIAYYVTEIAKGHVDPLSGLSDLMGDVYWEYDFQTPTQEYLGDSHGIECLIGYYWGYDDMMERPDEISCNGKYRGEGVIELKKEIKREARAWRERFAKKTLKTDPFGVG